MKRPRPSGLVHTLRHELADRDGWRCFYCARQLTCRRCAAREEMPQRGETATLDHRVALCNGGTNELDNLVLACERCNGKKADGSANKLMTGFLGQQYAKQRRARRMRA